MRIHVVTLFPQLFTAHLETSVLGRALKDGVVHIELHDLRAHGLGRHRTVDDEPYGGGAGMVMRPEPFFDAVEAIGADDKHVVLMSPRGALFTHAQAARLAAIPQLVLLCGRYEGVDERVAEHLADEELSVGDYVLAGGEVAALVVLEAVARLVPGVVGNAESLVHESHSDALLEYPQYTRPAEFRGHGVPEVLLSGDHGAVERWRKEQSRRITRARRPDLLLSTTDLSDED
jgi:tRNA (guanine37-N1)-methyltransferase